jgi:predicted ATPase
MFNSALDTHAEMAFSHERALATMDSRAEDSLEVVAQFMTALAASSASLEAQLEQSRLHAIKQAQRQHVVEQSLLKIMDITADMSARHMHQNELLIEATNRTREIVDQLGSFAPLSSIFSSIKFNWWPQIVSPIVFLVAGSFGLPPSLLRNLALLSLGEGFGTALTIILHRH